MFAHSAPEPSFRDSVDIMFNREVALLDMPPGLAEKSEFVMRLIR